MSHNSVSIDEKLPVLCLRLRALVLALGESASPSWWRTGLMTETGLKYLERLYPRTYFHAAVYTAGKAAARVHDNAAGRRGVYHLFRLPDAFEADIRRSPFDRDVDFLGPFREALGRQKKLMELIRPLGDESIDYTPGAKRLGGKNDLLDPKGLARSAGVYFKAFTEGKPSFPYFTEEEEDQGGPA